MLKRHNYLVQEPHRKKEDCDREPLLLGLRHEREPLLCATISPLDGPQVLDIENEPLECARDQWQKRRRKKVGTQSQKWMRRAAAKGRL